jgi:hypothetical protein
LAGNQSPSAKTESCSTSFIILQSAAQDDTPINRQARLERRQYTSGLQRNDCERALSPNPLERLEQLEQLERSAKLTYFFGGTL